MWEIIIIAGDKFNKIYEIFNKLNVNYRCSRNYIEILTQLIHITILRNVPRSCGKRVDIIYCDELNEEEKLIIYPCLNKGGIIRPLKELNTKIGVNLYE